MKLLKRIVVVLAVAFVAAVAISVVKPDLLSIRDLENFFAAPGQSIQSLTNAGTSAAKEAAQKLADKGASAAEKAQNEAMNQIVDSSGLKDAAASTLHAHAGDIAAATGLDEWSVNYVIDSMDIPSWQATTLPSDTYIQTSVPFTYGDTNATITTYTDPAYMTVEAYGQEVTFAVPEAAQDYIPYLAYIG